MKEAKLRVILVSSVRPERSSAGAMLLHRHLIGCPELDVEVYGEESRKTSIFGILRLLIAKCVINSGLREAAWTLLSGRWISLPSYPESTQPTVVLTVAHGDGYLAAMRLAKNKGWPLVSIYHDWWPNLAAPPGAIRQFIEKRFRSLYKKSEVALCVSEGMQNFLGDHPDARILYPIPNGAFLPASPSNKTADTPFRILFFGNMGIYGDLISDALKTFHQHPNIRFEARGGEVAFPPDFETQMRAEGLLLPHTSEVATFQEWAETADAFLIPQTFDADRRVEMETNFPSKLLEASRYGKPLIAWGPTWGSIIRWAKNSDAALTVTNSAPAELLRSAEKLASDIIEQRRLSETVTREANLQFHPDQIQKVFIGALRKAAQR